MIDHIGLNVSNIQESRAFYERALAPLNYEIVADDWGWVGFGVNDDADFWITEGAAMEPPVHIAFRCGQRSQVDAFYSAAIAAGGLDNGKPGIRDIYHSNYYGAYVLDPDGNNIEAVCHAEEEPEEKISIEDGY